MKKNIYLYLILAGLTTMASCSSDPEYDASQTINVSQAQLDYNSDGVWADNLQPQYINLGGYEFSHSVDDYGYAYGFTPSKVSDTSKYEPISSMTYASASGGGLSGAGSQYLVGYWAEWLESSDPTFNQRTCRIYSESGTSFRPKSVMVCNTTYVMYAALDGTGFTGKFKPGDWVTLTAHGVHLDGTETASDPFYLINIESTDVKSGILTSWKKFDISKLGDCTGIYFTMDCSHVEGEDNFKGDYGMNFPAYFCIDNLIVEE